MTRTTHFISIFSILISVSVNGVARGDVGEHDQNKSTMVTVKEQLQRIHWHTLQDDNKWGYTIETTLENGNGGKKVQQTKQRFDPSKPIAQQWQLLESDYEKPTPARMSEYKNTQIQIAKDATRTDFSSVDIVDLSTLTLLEKTTDTARFSFTPSLPMFDKDINQLFQGVLTFDLATRKITKLVIEAQESFSPRVSFKMERYLITIDIVNEEGELHVSRIASNKAGSAFFFTSFNEKSSRYLSHFKKMY